MSKSRDRKRADQGMIFRDGQLVSTGQPFKRVRRARSGMAGLEDAEVELGMEAVLAAARVTKIPRTRRKA